MSTLPAIRIGALGFFAEKHVVAGDADRLAAEVADHSHQSRVDLLGQHAGDDVDRLIGGDAEAADEFGFQAGLLHRGGDRLAAAVHDDRVDARHFEKHDVAHDLGDQLRVSMAEPPILMRKVLPRKAWR
jgi:hypothetical protein